MADHILDNPVWSSIAGTHAHLADRVDVGSGGAGRYQRDVSPFGGVSDPADPDAWKALDELLAGHGVVLIMEPERVPDGWEVTAVRGGVQMDGSGLKTSVDPELTALAAADVTEMLGLIERARPGPFLNRTVEMGGYVGLRRDQALVAMAGRRLHPQGWAEISAVCTDEAHRRQGLGARMVRTVGAGLRAEDRQPFLHAADTNVNAIRLYEALGFHLRRTVSFITVRRASA